MGHQAAFAADIKERQTRLDSDGVLSAIRLHLSRMCDKLYQAEVYGMLDKFGDMGYTGYQYACADQGPCAMCRILDGQVFANDEAHAGRNLPQLHPNCRCTIRPAQVEVGKIGNYENGYPLGIPLREVAERLGATVTYDASTKTAQVSFPNGKEAWFTDGVVGAWVDPDGVMYVNSNQFAKALDITNVLTATVGDKVLYFVNYGNEKVDIIWDQKLVGTVRVPGRIRRVSVSPLDTLNRLYYERFGSAAEAIDANFGEVVGGLSEMIWKGSGATAQIIYEMVSYLIGNPFGKDLSDANTLIQLFYEGSSLTPYVALFLYVGADAVRLIQQ